MYLKITKSDKNKLFSIIFILINYFNQIFRQIFDILKCQKISYNEKKNYEILYLH